MNGFYNYYAVTTNFRALNAFYYHVLSHWLRCLRQRSQRLRLTWRKMMRIAERWLPCPKLRHPYPDWRFDVTTPWAPAPGCTAAQVAARCVSSAGRDLYGGGEQSPSLPRRRILDFEQSILGLLRRSPPPATDQAG